MKNEGFQTLFIKPVYTRIPNLIKEKKKEKENYKSLGQHNKNAQQKTGKPNLSSYKKSSSPMVKLHRDSVKG